MSEKSFCVRSRTNCAFLSRTVASTLTPWKSDENEASADSCAWLRTATEIPPARSNNNATIKGTGRGLRVILFSPLLSLHPPTIYHKELSGPQMPLYIRLTATLLLAGIGWTPAFGQTTYVALAATSASVATMSAWSPAKAAAYIDKRSA